MNEGDLLLFREGFIPEKSIQLTSDEYSHLKARRLGFENHLIEIRDGIGKSYLYQYSPKKKELDFISQIDLPKKENRLTIAIALPKGNRLDYFIQKATEIGITKIIFCLFQHSIRKDFNQDRAKKIISEAAIQSKQTILAEFEILTLNELLSREKENLFLFDPHSETKFELTMLREKIPLIGPEGGFHKDEIHLMNECKVQGAKLEGGILRTETAGIVAASLLAYGL
ncbi:MAG: RsmE family RNA methyltransferase [Leptospira sp.]|nr:RsmE family RNA methyltransferase [Leptospira sp.]